MNSRILSAIGLLLFATSGLAGLRKIAYERDGNIFVADLDGSHAEKVATGTLPAISPDGARVAFTDIELPEPQDIAILDGPQPKERIAIVDLASRKTTILKGLGSDHCFDAAWSPNGNQLAFIKVDDNEPTQIGIVDADGSNFRLLKYAKLVRGVLSNGPEWSRDGKSIFYHNLENLYRVDLDGKTMNKWEFAKILTDASIDSHERLSVSPDGKRLLIDADSVSEHERKNGEGPQRQAVIEMFVLGADKAVRVTGQDDFVWGPSWLSEDEFLCVMQKEDENEPSIYRMPVNGRNPKLIVKDARTPSVSAP